MHARMTLVGMENLLNATEDTSRSLKDPWELTDVDFNAETLLSAIMIKGAQFEPLFTDPIFFYNMNQQWWNKWKHTFQKWMEVLEKDYEPLWDREGWEEIADHTDRKGTLDATTTGHEVVDDDTTNTATVTSNTLENTVNKVSAYDAGDNLVVHDATDDTTANTTTSNAAGTDDRTTDQRGTVDQDTTGEEDYSHHLHSWGNWGISQTVQKLRNAELETQYWNIYEHMSDIFLDEMTVRVF